VSLANGGPWPPIGVYAHDRKRYRHDRRLMMSGLELVLYRGPSAYRINDTATGLVRRVDITTIAGFEAAAAAADAQPHLGSAADQIRDAWTTLDGISSNPPLPYRAAVQAVESAMEQTRTHAGGRPPEDDLTLLVVESGAAGPTRPKG